MAKPFNKKEKVIIKQALIKKGRDLFLKFGIRKTSIKDITDSVNIAQGTFYNFYNSKEEFYFEIMELEEKKISEILIKLINKGKLKKERFKSILIKYIELISGNIFIKNLLMKDEYNLLLRKLPDEKVKKHIKNEVGFLKNIINTLTARNALKEIKPDLLHGILYSLFLLTINKKQIGDKTYPQVIRYFIDIIIDDLAIS
jgi:AcrR family transcriptional regulator